MASIQLPRRTYYAGHFALKRARCVTLPARAGGPGFPWYAHLTVDIFEGQDNGTASARQVVPYARACVWGLIGEGIMYVSAA